MGWTTYVRFPRMLLSVAQNVILPSSLNLLTQKKEFHLSQIRPEAENRETSFLASFYVRDKRMGFNEHLCFSTLVPLLYC